MVNQQAIGQNLDTFLTKGDLCRAFSPDDLRLEMVNIDKSIKRWLRRSYNYEACEQAHSARKGRR
jgi:hypothetical protein